MDQVFNELSFSGSLADISTANIAMENMMKASNQLMSYGFSRQIRVSEDTFNREIIPGCTFRQYLTARTTGSIKTLQQALFIRFSGAPHVEKLCIDEGLTELEEYHIEKIPCKGLALAKLWGIPALSLAGDEHFVPPYVTITHSFLSEGTGEIKEESEKIGIICAEIDIIHHKNTIRERLYNPLRNGQNLYNYATQQLFCLTFSSTAKTQLAEMQNGDPWLPRILDILCELHRAMQDAIEKDAAFSPCGFHYTPTESSSATQGKKGEAHTFRFMEQGIPILLMCQSHMRITDGARIYFDHDKNKKIVYIGHIGEHLPTKKFG